MNRTAGAGGQRFSALAHAKINLTLDVLSRRTDGYHSISTVLQSISLADQISVTLIETPGLQFVCESPEAEVPLGVDNLAARAAAAVLDAALPLTGEPCGVRVELLKSIPAQAGLGGGSSDAAMALALTNCVLGSPLPKARLGELAADLGSDVPFFLVSGTAVARGRGESVTALPDLPTLWLVLVKPEEGVSTQWAYGALDAVPNRISHRASGRLEALTRSGDFDRLIPGLCNDFDAPVMEHRRDIAWLRDELEMAGALTAHLCGSGAAVYSVAESEEAAQRIATRFHGRYPFVAVAHTVSRQEALEDLDDQAAALP